MVGANGSGKSTLLRTLAGLLRPSEGEVTLPDGDARRTLGYGSVESQLYPHLTAAEHLQLGGDLRGIAPNIEALLAEVGLQSAADRFTGQFSTGMRARLKLALAIQAAPPILFLDEPGAGLDAGGRALVARLAVAQRERGVLILATNDPEERRLANLELALDA